MSSFTLSAQSISDRIQRGCGGLGGAFVQALTDFSGNILLTVCTGKSVYICNSAGVCTPITPGGPSGSGTAGTIPLWTTPTNLGNSILTQTGTSAVTLGAGSFIYTQVAAPSVSAANFGKVYFDSTSKTLKGSYNGAAYFDFLRGNVTNGTLPIANTTGNVFGDSFATQSGNNFTVTQPLTGAITLGRVAAGRPNLIIDDNSSSIIGRFNITSVLNLSANAQTMGTGAALVDLNSTGGIVTLGDVLATNNFTTLTVDDPNRLIEIKAGSTLIGRFDRVAARARIGDPDGNDNGTEVDVNEGAGTIDLVGAAGGAAFRVNGIANTFTLNHANYFNCIALTTNGSGVIGCTISDARLKNIQGKFSRGLSALAKIQPVTYSFKPGRYFDPDHNRSGFTAQNVAAAIPEAVMPNGAGDLQIDQATVLATTINAVNELAAKVEAQAVELRRLRRQIRRRH